MGLSVSAFDGEGLARSRGCGKGTGVVVGGTGEGVQAGVAGTRVRVGGGKGTVLGAQAHKHASNAQQLLLAILWKELGFDFTTGQAFNAENLVACFRPGHHLNLGSFDS